MNEKEKDLLIKDLCARLPYGVKCKYYDCCEGDYYEGTICGFEKQEYIQIDGVCIYIEEVKPYLFPMSSMTDEQKMFLKQQNWCIAISTSGTIKTTIEGIDWLNKNHFDFRGLIPMDLAIDATGLDIY